MHPVDHLVRSKLLAELDGIGVESTELEVTPLDNAQGAVVIRIVSAAFEGQTFLDREMRVRPAISRAFAMTGRVPTEAVLDLVSPDELENELTPLPDTPDGRPEDENDRASRRLWRETRRSLLEVLKASRYEIEILEDEKVYVAHRSGLSSEKVLIGFSVSPRVTTVDLAVRSAMETARQAEHYQSWFYLVPEALSAPFANQRPAKGLRVETPLEFLHLLDSSSAIAAALRSETVEELAPAKELSGKVVEPACTLDGASAARPFFDAIEDWLSSPESSLLVLMAPAGHGKTTLTLELTRRLANQFSLDSSQILPLFVPFQSVRRTVDFEALLHRRLAELGGSSYAAHAELIKRGAALLVVDGFDELADDAGMQAAENQVRSIRPLLQGKAKVLLAGRTAFATQFGGDDGVGARMRSLLGDVSVSVLNVRRFDAKQIEEFVESRVGLEAQKQRDVLAFRDSSPDHEELCANPLFLRLLCGLSHSGGLPTATEDDVPDINGLLVKVCEREEERQHLALGVDRQLEYLGDLAVEQFRRGESSVTHSDATLAAEMLSTGNQKGSPELVGRLLDHALLTTRGADRLAFLHPLLRDAMLARVIDLKAEHSLPGALKACAADHRDLPEATVRWLASSGRLLSSAPAGWLSKPNSLPSTARRNLLRIAMSAASRADNPRHWWDERWLVDGVISHIDLSELEMDSRSFDNFKFDTCTADGAMFSDCDFRGTNFDACSLSEALFFDCRISTATAAKRSVAHSVYVYAHGEWQKLESADEWLQSLGQRSEELQTFTPVPEFGQPIQPVADVRATVVRLFRDVIESLISSDGTKFHTVQVYELERPNLPRDERRAVEKVVVPAVLSYLCERELRGGSREVAYLDGRWRAALANFVQNGRTSLGLSELLSDIVAKAARYLE